jgi:UPF0716 protein FxsA
VTPGVLTDAVGFLGLLPPTRALIRRLLMRRLKSKVEEGSLQMQFGFFGGAAPGPNGNGAPPNRPSSSNGDNQRWEGKGRQIPRHTDSDSGNDAKTQS